MNARKRRVALIGLGGVAQQIHLPACALLPNVDVVASCDPDASARARFAARFGARNTFIDYREMLSSLAPDVVIVGTPPFLHHAACCAALEAGAHVLCEKPFARTLAEADDMIECARRNKRALRVNNQYRYMQHYVETKARLLKGEFGRLFSINVWQQMMHPPSMELNWRSSLAEYVLFEFGTHVFDLLCFFFDALPSALTFRMPRCRSEYKSDVVVCGLLDFPEERIATLFFNRISHAPRKYLEMRLDCELASIRISLGGVARIAVDITNNAWPPNWKAGFVKGGQATVERQGRTRVLCNASRPQFAPATAENLRLLLADAEGSAPLSSVLLSRQILGMTFAGYTSARNRQTVQFDSLQSAEEAAMLF